MSSTTPRLRLDLRPERFAVTRLEAGAPVPDWASVSAFASITRTANELSVVCVESSVPNAPPARRGLRCLSVRGPLDFAQVGVLAALARPLAEAGVSIFVVSTFDTDHLFVPDESLDVALESLRRAGHVVSPTSSPSR